MDRPKREVADVFRRYGEAYREQNGAPMSTAQRRVMTAIELCRTAALGGHLEQCDECGHERNCFNSCRDRHCPKCQSLARAQWIEDRQAELGKGRFGINHERNRPARGNTARLSRPLRGPHWFISVGMPSLSPGPHDCDRSHQPFRPPRLRRHLMRSAVMAFHFALHELGPAESAMECLPRIHWTTILRSSGHPHP